MGLMAYHCEECSAEFTMDERVAHKADELACPVCGEGGSVEPVVDDEDDDGPGNRTAGSRR